MFNRTLPVLSVMMGYAERPGLRPRGSNPCKGMPRYKRKPMERFLSPHEYGRLATTLSDYEAEQPLYVAAIRLLIFTGARCGEIEQLRWEWVQEPRLMLPDSKTGENNESLYLSIRDAAGRLGMADLTAVRSAFDELQELGFIEMTESASFHVKAAEKSRARCWRLTWLAGSGRKGPSMAFMNCQRNPGTKAHKRMERGMRTLKAFRKARDSGRLPVLDSDTEG